MLKKLLVPFLFTFAVVLLVIVFRHSLLEFALNRNVPLDGGWKFQYEGLGFEKHRVVFKGISFATKKGHVRGEIEKLSIGLDRRVGIENARVRMDRSDGDLVFDFAGGRFTVDVDQAMLELIEGDKICVVHASVKSDDLGQICYLSKRGENPDVIQYGVCIEDMKYPMNHTI